MVTFQWFGWSDESFVNIFHLVFKSFLHNTRSESSSSLPLYDDETSNTLSCHVMWLWRHLPWHDNSMSHINVISNTIALSFNTTDRCAYNAIISSVVSPSDGQDNSTTFIHKTFNTIIRSFSTADWCAFDTFISSAYAPSENHDNSTSFIHKILIGTSKALLIPSPHLIL